MAIGEDHRDPEGDEERADRAEALVEAAEHEHGEQHQQADADRDPDHLPPEALPHVTKPARNGERAPGEPDARSETGPYPCSETGNETSRLDEIPPVIGSPGLRARANTTSSCW